MKEIPLTQGRVALVDDADYSRVSQYKWWFDGNYACRQQEGPRSTRKNIRMHRFILGLESGDGTNVDHKDSNRLNNQRENLRLCNRSQNGHNRLANKNSKTGVKGVSFHRQSGKFTANITTNRKTDHLGLFNTLESAAAAYVDAAKNLHGEFARC